MRHRRLAAALFALVLMAAACGDDDGGTTAGDTTPSGAPATVPAEGTGSTQPPGTGSDTTESVDESTTSTQATTTTAPPPSVTSVGGFARFYLRPSESASVLLDIHAQEGAAPRQGTLDHLVSVLGKVSGKQVETSVSSLGGSAKAWTADELRALGDANGPEQTRQRAVLRLFYVRGSYAESDTVVGVAVRSDVAAMFVDKFSEAAGVLGSTAAVEDAVTMHEVGHILGLVDVVLDTGREDPEHPGHSRSTNSVMYYAVESTLLSTILEGGPPRDFDADDLNDLAMIRNG